MAVLIRKTQQEPGRNWPADHVVVGLQAGAESLLVQGGDALYLAAASLQPAAVQALLTAAVGVTVFPAPASLGVVTTGALGAFLAGQLFLDGSAIYLDGAAVLLT